MREFSVHFQIVIFSSANHTTFRAHKSKKHKHHTVHDLRTSICTALGAVIEFATSSSHGVLSEAEEAEEIQEEAPISDLDPVDTEHILEHKLAALFLCMQTKLHEIGRAHV